MRKIGSVREVRGLNKPAIAAQHAGLRRGRMLSASDQAEAASEQHRTPRLCIGRGWTVYRGPVQQNRPHSHHLVQIAWSPDAKFELVAGAYRVCGAGHVVDAGAPHCLQSAEPVRLLFLDPTMPVAKAWRKLSGGNACELTAAQIHELEARLQQWDGDQHGEGHEAPARGVREQTLGEWLKVNLDQPLRASDAAQIIGLSEGRFLHWFTVVHGLPFRPYVRWLRLQRALRSLAEGANLTAAAHASGFADSAHLSRTFVASFGIAPRGLQQVTILLSQSAGPNLAGALPP